MKPEKEPQFLYDDFGDRERRELEKIIKTVSRRPSKQDAKAMFLKNLTFQMFNAYRRKKVGERKEEKKVQPIKVKAEEKVEKPIVKPKKPKKIELEEAPKPVYKKVLPTREILRSGGVIVKAAYKNGIYNLIEPELNENEEKILDKLEEEIGKKISKNKKLASDKEFIKEKINKIAEDMKIPINIGTYDKIQYYLIRDKINFGKIDGLLRDVNVKEIICDGVNEAIKVKYRGEEAVSDVVFESKEELNSLIKKFAKLADKKISEEEPFLKATLPSGIRVQASLSSDLSDARFVINK